MGRSLRSQIVESLWSYLTVSSLLFIDAGIYTYLVHTSARLGGFIPDYMFMILLLFCGTLIAGLWWCKRSSLIAIALLDAVTIVLASATNFVRLLTDASTVTAQTFTDVTAFSVGLLAVILTLVTLNVRDGERWRPRRRDGYEVAVIEVMYV